MTKLRPTPRAPGLAPEVEEIPLGIRRLAAWSWRIIVIVAATTVILYGALQVTGILIPVLLAVLLAVMLTPVVKILTRYTFLGRAAASGVSLLGLLLVVAGMFTLAGRQLIAQWADIQAKAVYGFQSITNWVTTTFQIDDTMINSAIDEGLAKLQENAETLVNSAVSTAAVLGNLATGIVICLFTLFFLLSSGPTIWRWVVGLMPPAARLGTHEAFRRGWKALSAYVRTQIMVAAVDAVGIALGMVFLGLGSYAVPIWLLVFLFSFVPLVGAIASGAIAILLVLVLQNWIFALIMLGIVLLVQQLESNILQPFLMGKAVELHPLAVFLGVAGGAMIAGIPGALFAIPLIAFVNATLLYIVGRDPSPELGTDQPIADHFSAISAASRAHAQSARTGLGAQREAVPAGAADGARSAGSPGSPGSPGSAGTVPADQPATEAPVAGPADATYPSPDGPASDGQASDVRASDGPAADDALGSEDAPGSTPDSEEPPSSRP